MLNWLEEKLIKKFLLDGLDNLLSKIPLNGRKTIISIVLTLLLVIAQYFGIDGGTLGNIGAMIVEWLKHAGGAPIIDVTTIGVLVGLLHKAVKWIKALLEKRQAAKETQ